MGYQTFSEEEKGSSNSFAKLNALKLPNKLNGKKVLDIGCNEGFFCFEAAKRRAEHVTGIDINEKAIKRANEKNQYTNVNFLNQSWDTLPDNVYDLIIFASALHYVNNPKALFDIIYKRLNDNGLLILECGFVDKELKEFSWVERSKSIRLFPTKKILFDNYLSQFAPKLVGKSIKQKGDPLQRYVLHCKKRKPIIWLIKGKGSSGKTTITRELFALNAQIIKLDSLFHFIRNLKNPRSEIHTILQDFLLQYNGSIKKTVDAMHNNNNLLDELVNKITEMICFEERNIIIEGYALTDEICDRLINRIKKRAICWEVTRSKQDF